MDSDASKQPTPPPQSDFSLDFGHFTVVVTLLTVVYITVVTLLTVVTVTDIFEKYAPHAHTF